MKDQNIGTKLGAALHDLVGKTIMYNTRNYKILAWRVKDGIVTIVADPKWIELVETTAYSKIRKEFRPAPDEENEGMALRTLPKNGEMANLKKILIQNIKNVQDNEEFVQQGNTINKSVNAVINLAKLELSFLKAQQDKY